MAICADQFALGDLVEEDLTVTGVEPTTAIGARTRAFQFTHPGNQALHALALLSQSNGTTSLVVRGVLGATTVLAHD
jgi:hypothetical protein